MVQLETSEFYTACFLRARGSKLLSIQKTGPRFSYTFESKHPDLLEEYDSGGSISAVAFVSAISFIKRAMAATA